VRHRCTKALDFCQIFTPVLLHYSDLQLLSLESRVVAGDALRTGKAATGEPVLKSGILPFPPFVYCLHSSAVIESQSFSFAFSGPIVGYSDRPFAERPAWVVFAGLEESGRVSFLNRRSIPHADKRREHQIPADEGERSAVTELHSPTFQDEDRRLRCTANS
jgi:hypothetical protein